jgi:hypothetical protein
MKLKNHVFFDNDLAAARYIALESNGSGPPSALD